MKRNWFGLLIASIFVAGVLSSCSQSKPISSAGDPQTSASTQTASATSDLLTKIQEKGEIVVAMEGTWAPWTYHDESDTLVGYDVEIAQKIAEKLGVKATFVEGEWDGLLAGLDAGRYDIMVNGVNITEERSQKYDFSVPYAYDRTAVIVSGDRNEIQSFEDLKGKQTANTISSTYATLAESYGATVTGVDDLNQTFELLLSGRIDATLNAEVTYYDYMKAHPDANLKIAVLNEDATPIAIPMRKGEETATLREAVDKALDELRTSGKLTELSQKYFNSDISSLTAAPTETSSQAAPNSTSSASTASSVSESTPATTPTNAARTTEVGSPQPMQVRIGTTDKTIVFQLNDSSAAKSLYEQLPLSIGVENYASNEKIFYPPEKLDTADTPLLSSGDIGTLGYYEPWGDVILFYGSSSPASGLYVLGNVISGATQIESLSGTIQVDAYTAS